MDSARALLDSLMGMDRNGEGRGDEWKGEDVCKNHLVAFCPHNLFQTTTKRVFRSVQPCQKNHSDALRTSFEGHEEYEKYRDIFERDLRADLEALCFEADQFAVQEAKNLRQAGVELRLPSELKQKYKEYNTRYAELCKESEELGEKGEIEAANNVMSSARAIKGDIDDLRKRFSADYEGEEVCKTCGTRVRSGDSDAARAKRESHLNGRTHAAYSKVREKLAELKERRSQRESGREAVRTEKKEEKKEDGDANGKRSRSRDRRRRSTSRDRKRKNSRSRSRGRTSRR
mmetsp:Transcript_50966/g.134293  ORF Transcript_50966/g.134293 Transcript_50966/m.134293 type:complete len:288 (+) Transcript_50966:93-956(+)